MQEGRFRSAAALLEKPFYVLATQNPVSWEEPILCPRSAAGRSCSTSLDYLTKRMRSGCESDDVVETGDVLKKRSVVPDMEFQRLVRKMPVAESVMRSASSLRAPLTQRANPPTS